MVDAAEAEIGLVMQDLVHRQLHAIHRCTGTLPGLDTIEKRYRMQAQGLANGNGVTHARLRFIRGYHYNFSQVFYCFYQVVNAWCRNAVVVCYQYNWLSFLLFCHIRVTNVGKNRETANVKRETAVSRRQS